MENKLGVIEELSELTELYLVRFAVQKFIEGSQNLDLTELINQVGNKITNHTKKIIEGLS